ncbi:hypothetical protein GJ744_007291 [Endocarpon pusillum]|uniref:Major facilitator superfamily (MFS) profile domain-containing protein n=1 Tax=Endocarpon pusillum TaxID=364733 RepID=A0A8H7AN64_9EURO|nr:hypothetical protein GJ744_007291 [Endocarpon pusillum]
MPDGVAGQNCSGRVQQVCSEKNKATQEDDLLKPVKRSLKSRLFSLLCHVPSRCRYDPNQPFEFSIGLNLLFAFGGCFTVANLYYNHPILNLLARDFGVTEYQSSYVPTLAQAGYAGGLLFLCPLGDLLRRRPFVLLLVWFTATVWIGLCVTTSFSVFCALSLLTSLSTVTPQLMLPLVGDLAPAHRRAAALSIVVSGLLLGLLVARLLSGVVAQYVGWRYIYWISFALQYLILILLWLFMPDYPSTNPVNSWVELLQKYPGLLFDIIRMPFRHPVLVQACLFGFLTSSTFNSFWTTLTFLLSSPPYNYTSLAIGLFALIGIVSMTWGPFFARTVMDKHHPLFSVLLGTMINLVGIVVGTYTGKISIAGPVIQALFVDIGLQTSQTANRTAIYQVEPKGRNRVNTAFMVSIFGGQLMGTAVGNRLYDRGGWIASGSANVGFICAALLVCLLRGPHEPGWVGWSGGWNMRKESHPLEPKVTEPDDVEKQAEGSPEAESEKNSREMPTRAEA